MSQKMIKILIIICKILKNLQITCYNLLTIVLIALQKIIKLIIKNILKKNL